MNHEKLNICEPSEKDQDSLETIDKLFGSMDKDFSELAWYFS
jgi:hypothetical protein